MKDKTFKKSKSESHGLKLLKKDFKNILSVGISTGGSAEIMMAKKCPNANIIATTIDEKGLEFSKNKIEEFGFSDRINAKIEDVSKKSDYPNDYFDFVYARLVLHYLDKQQLNSALKEIHRILKPCGKFFIVARSNEEWELKVPSAVIDYNPETNITTYYEQGKQETIRKRQFLSMQEFSAQLESNNFKIIKTKKYKEFLYTDYERTIKSKHPNSLIELIVTK